MFTEILTIGFAMVANSNHQAGGDCFANRATGDTWHVGNEWFCGVVPDTTEITVNHIVVNPAPAIVSLVSVETVSEDNSVSTPAPIVQEEKKLKCNNGEGNGSEGCSPANSEHANNDENNTTPKEDKSHK
jgi:hypothetical protein